MTDLISPAHILTFGKYIGKDINTIIKCDESYCSWLLRHKESSKLNDEQIKILESNIREDECYIGFGKYKNRSIKWIFENDKKYIYYLKNNDYIKNNKQDILDSIKELEA